MNKDEMNYKIYNSISTLIGYAVHNEIDKLGLESVHDKIYNQICFEVYNIIDDLVHTRKFIGRKLIKYNL